METRKPLVAIIDDEESIRTALQRLFRFSRYQAEVFASGHEFLEFSSEHEPDCVVIDMRMPGMTGLDLIRHLSGRKHPPPMIVITGDTELRTKDECMALGTKYFFTKPIDGKLLLDSVDTILSIAPQ